MIQLIFQNDFFARSGLFLLLRTTMSDFIEVRVREVHEHPDDYLTLQVKIGCQGYELKAAIADSRQFANVTAPSSIKRLGLLGDGGMDIKEEFRRSTVLTERFHQQVIVFEVFAPLLAGTDFVSRVCRA